MGGAITIPAQSAGIAIAPIIMSQRRVGLQFTIYLVEPPI